MKLYIKFYKQVHFTKSIHILIICLIILFVMINKNNYDFNLKTILWCIFLGLLPILFFLFLRTTYPYKYVIDGAYLKKYRYKEVIFKIRIKDIRYIGIRKRPRCRILKFIASILIGFRTHYFDTISFIYSKCEFVKPYHRIEGRTYLKEYLDNTCESFEYTDLLSLKDTINLCKLLEVPYKIKEANE